MINGYDVLKGINDAGVVLSGWNHEPGKLSFYIADGPTTHTISVMTDHETMSGDVVEAVVKSWQAWEGANV